MHKSSHSFPSGNLQFKNNSFRNNLPHANAAIVLPLSVYASSVFLKVASKDVGQASSPEVRTSQHILIDVLYLNAALCSDSKYLWWTQSSLSIKVIHSLLLLDNAHSIPVFLAAESPAFFWWITWTWESMAAYWSHIEPDFRHQSKPNRNLQMFGSEYCLCNAVNKPQHYKLEQ